MENTNAFFNFQIEKHDFFGILNYFEKANLFFTNLVLTFRQKTRRREKNGKGHEEKQTRKKEKAD